MSFRQSFDQNLFSLELLLKDFDQLFKFIIINKNS